MQSQKRQEHRGQRVGVANKQAIENFLESRVGRSDKQWKCRRFSQESAMSAWLSRVSVSPGSTFRVRLGGWREVRLKVEGFTESQSLRQWLPPPITAPPSYRDGDPVASVYCREKTSCDRLKKTEQTAWGSETSVMAVSDLDKVHCLQACGVMGWQGAESCRPHSHSAGRLPAHMPTLLVINSNTGTHSGKHFCWCRSRRRCLWVSPSQIWEISKDYWGIWVN